MNTRKRGSNGLEKRDAFGTLRLVPTMRIRYHPFTMRPVQLALFGLGMAVACARADELPVSPLPAAGTYYLVVTGGELLEGVYPDGHTHFLTRTLHPTGLRCVGAVLVDDLREDMLAALHFATNRAPVVLVTGGLGPTPNDITRETLSAFTGIPLAESEAALAELERRFRQPRDQLRPNLRRQCQVPARGGFFPNPHGTAVGLFFDLGPGRAIVALPGPPRELQPMVRDQLLPWLRERFGARPPGASLTLRFVGAGQSLIDQTIKDKVALPPEVIVTSLFEGSRVDFTFHLPGHEPTDFQRLTQLGAEVRRHLQEYCYAEGDTTLEEVVLRGLRDRGLRLALAEVASGGSLTAALNGAAEAPSVLMGAFVAPNEPRLGELTRAGAWRADAPAETRARVLAEAAAAHAGATWAVAVGESAPAVGDAGVWVAVKADERFETRRFSLRDRSEAARLALVTQILDQLRRLLRAP